MFNLDLKRIAEGTFLLIFLIQLVLSANIFFNNFNNPYQHFTVQAQSFLYGKLDIPVEKFINADDFTIKDDKYYWPQGPFPSVFMLPFVFLYGQYFTQSHAQILLAIILIFSLIKMSSKNNFSKNSSFYLIWVFIFGSPIIALIFNPASSQFAQITALTFQSVLLCKFLYNTNPLITGILNSLILATRPTAALAIIPLSIYYLSKKYHKILLFLFPQLITLFLLGLFNQVRFDSFFDNGYSTNNIHSLIEALRTSGVFHWSYIPTNIYYYFLISFQPIIENTNRLVYPYITYSQWGLSIFLCAPFFLYSLKTLKKPTKLFKTIWISITVTVFIFLTYYHPGWVQFGPRYFADIMPVLFLLTLNGLTPPNLTYRQKLLIVLSTSVNVYLYIFPLIDL